MTCRKVGVTDAAFQSWRPRFDGMVRPQLSDLREPEKENARLRKIVAELGLGKVIRKESLDHLGPRAERLGKLSGIGEATKKSPGHGGLGKGVR